MAKMKIGKTFKKLMKSKDKSKGPDKDAGGDLPPGAKDLEDLLDEVGDLGDLDDLGDMPGVTGDGGGGEAPESDERLEARLNDTDGKIQKVEKTLTSAQKESEKIRGEITELQYNIRKLLSIYEIVYKDINPFIEDDDEETLGMTSLDEGGMEMPEPLSLDGEVSDDSSAIKIEIGTSTGKGMSGEIVGDVKSLLDEGRYEEAFLLLDRGIEDQKRIEEREGESDMDSREMRTRELLGSPKKGPILTEIPVDYLSNVTLMRWLEFLLERIPRKKITLLLEYYVSNGWISSKVKYRVVGYLRGELGGYNPPPPEPQFSRPPPQGPPRPPFSHLPELQPMEETFQSWDTSPPPPYHQEDPYQSHGPRRSNGNGRNNNHPSWRLSAEDHLKSLLFINMIAGNEINRDRLTCREYDIEIIKHALEDYHGI